MVTSCFNVGLLPVTFDSPQIFQNINQILYLNFSFDTWSCNRKSIWIDSLEPLTLNIDLWKFCDYKFCGRRDAQFLICHVTLCDPPRKGSWLNGSEPFTFSPHSANFVGNTSPLFTTLLSLLVNLVWTFHPVPKLCVHFNNCPLCRRFFMSVWPWFGWFQEKLSAITRIALYSMSAIDR